MTGPTVQTGKRATYPTYKPSGMDWVGDVPEHWDVRRLKYTASINDEALPETTDLDFEFTYVDIGSVDASKGIVSTETYRFEDAPSRARRIVRDGDTIVSTVRTYLRAIAAIRDPEESLIVSTGFAVVRPRSLDPGYLSYALRSPFFVETVVSRSTGVSYPAINAPEVGNIGVTLPPLDEQKAIAAFLDRETARIDALIEKKRRQIELLQEKRSALISHAVTKGLDPNAPMKDSGIEWLGEIPEHWKAVSLRRYLRVSSGDMISVNDFCEEGYPVFGGNGFRGYSDRWNTDSDTIIIGRYGALCGNVRVTEEPIWATEHAFRVIPLKRFHSKFLAAVIETLDLNRLSARTAQPGLNSEMVRNNVVGIPPLEEQQAIAGFVACETSRVDRLVSKIEISIETLREFRTSLISAAVTGKIDVRQVNP